MSNRFEVMNANESLWAGVIEYTQKGEVWVVEPEYPWRIAAKMAESLNANPDLDPDELTHIVEAK